MKEYFITCGFVFLFSWVVTAGSLIWFCLRTKKINDMEADSIFKMVVFFDTLQHGMSSFVLSLMMQALALLAVIAGLIVYAV